MDKIAINSLLVALRKDVKAAKSMVAGNLVRKINELKKASEKEPDPVKQEKADKKTQTLHAEIKLLKTLDSYQLSKKAVLKPDPKYWTDLVGDSKASMEDQLTGRVLAKNKIQKRVQEFRSDQKDLDEWIEEYFEFREKKRELTEVKVAKRKTKGNDRRSKPFNASESDRPFNKKPFSKNGNKEQGDRKARFEKRGGFNQGEPPHQQNTGARRSGRAHDQNQNRNQNQNQNQNRNQNQNQDQNRNLNQKQESLHPSWESKRKEKELLKAALSGKVPEQPKRVILNSA